MVAQAVAESESFACYYHRHHCFHYSCQTTPTATMWPAVDPRAPAHSHYLACLKSASFAVAAAAAAAAVDYDDVDDACLCQKPFCRHRWHPRQFQRAPRPGTSPQPRSTFQNGLGPRACSHRGCHAIA